MADQEGGSGGVSGGCVSSLLPDKIPTLSVGIDGRGRYSSWVKQSVGRGLASGHQIRPLGSRPAPYCLLQAQPSQNITGRWTCSDILSKNVSLTLSSRTIPRQSVVMDTITDTATMTTVISRWRQMGGGCLKANTAFSMTWKREILSVTLSFFLHWPTFDADSSG